MFFVLIFKVSNLMLISIYELILINIFEKNL